MVGVESELKIAALVQANFGVEIRKPTPKANQNGLKPPIRVAQRRAELHQVNNGRGRETVRHFFTLVPIRPGVFVKFNDIGSKAVKFEPEWKVTKTGKNPVLPKDE